MLCAKMNYVDILVHFKSVPLNYLRPNISNGEISPPPPLWIR